MQTNIPSRVLLRSINLKVTYNIPEIDLKKNEIIMRRNKADIIGMELVDLLINSNIVIPTGRIIKVGYSGCLIYEMPT